VAGWGVHRNGSGVGAALDMMLPSHTQLPMDAGADDPILRLAEAIADGRTLNPPSFDTDGAASDPVLRELRILGMLADVHRAAALGDAGTSWVEAAEAGTEVPAPPEWGPFRVLEEIGRGSFGVVYRAKDLRLDRDVALKIFAPRTAPATTTLLIAAEGRLLAKLNHPNVITVYGADVVDGTVGIWMELLRGRTLQQELDERGPLGAREAALIGIDLCRALAAVHKAGLVHRDLKAQNVMRAEGGRIVLMDFGAGHELTDPAALFRLAGTPLYMAPEVLQGSPATASSDLYSLGVLLYHLVTNAFPVFATTLDDLRDAHSSGSRRRLRDVRPDLPATFIRVVEDATAKPAADRTASAAALEEQLETLLLSAGKDRNRSGWSAGLRWAALVALIVISIALGAFNGLIRSWFTPSASGIRSLAVLPFRNLTEQPSQDYLADSVTSLLTGNLAQLKSLHVTSSTSAMASKGSGKGLSAIAKELGVDGVVEGAISGSRDRLRVEVRLFRGNEEFVWGDTYDRPGGDVFKVTGEMSGMIADAVRLSLTPEERRNLISAPGVEVQAQEAFLRGLHRLSDFRPDTLKLALADLTEAVRLDPRSARAYATLSQCYRMLGAAEVLEHGEAYRKALLAATEAIRLNDAVAEGHTELAEVKFYYEWNWEWAQSEYERALELNPNNSHAMARYSQFLSALKRTDEALDWARRAQELDPLSLTVRFTPGMALFYAGRTDEAIAEFRRLAELPPYALTASDHVGLARAYAARRQYPEAIQEMTIALRMHETPLTIWKAELARIHAEAGHRAEAVRMLTELEPQRKDIPAHIAFILIALGSVDEGFEALNQAADDRAPALLWMNVDPRFDRVRHDPRLRALALRIGIPP
jgi:eukaryotic-like serine/threonine-protein kinase